MTATRAVSRTGKNGAEWSEEVDDSLNAAFSYIGGLVVPGALEVNALTATLAHATGFAAYPSVGFRVTVRPTNNNTGAVTLDLGPGPISVRDQDDAVLTANKLIAGRAQPLMYHPDKVRFLFDGTALPAQVTVTEMNFVQRLIYNSGTNVFTATVEGYHRFICAGGGGGGVATTTSNTEQNGGGGGGYGVLSVYLLVGDQVTVVVGAGGAPALHTNASNGAATTLNATGVGKAGATNISCSAGGGQGGRYGTSGVSAATGGVASGFDVNLAGQSSPIVTTNGLAGCGGSLRAQQQVPATVANNTTTPTNMWTWLSPLSAIGPLSSNVAFTAGDSANSIPSRGCGSGTRIASSPANSGGNGFCIVEYGA